MSQKQQKKHKEFTATFSSDTTRKWQMMVMNWNTNKKAPNPYIEPDMGKSFLYIIYYYIAHF
jgi:hypothetical protein